MIKEYIVKKAIDAAIEQAKKLSKETDSEFLTTKEHLTESIRIHMLSVENWSTQVSFADLNKAKPLTGVFVELDLFIRPRRTMLRGEVINNIPLRSIFEYSNNHPILLGQPGAGKTTSMKHLCQLLLHDEEFQGDMLTFPILVRFRDLLKEGHVYHGSILIDQIFNILGLKIERSEKTVSNDRAFDVRAIKEKILISVLEEFKVLLILDGFDELGNISLSDQIIDEIRTLAIHLTNSKMIVTSRSGDFVYHIDNTIQYEISPLRDSQIEQFARKWLGNKQQTSKFLNQINDSPIADTTIRPLTLAYLCAIFERVGKIPDKPRSIYKKIINLLLEEWDQQRSVKRPSRYANFEVDRKFDFVCRLAYVLTTSLTATVFAEADLRVAYLQMYPDYDLLRHEAKKVVAELETHTGLFLEAGDDQYEFAHKSIQEYLTAEFIVKLPSIPENMAILCKLPNELAVAVSISSSSSDYLSELMLHVFKDVKLSEDFCRTFINRLLLEKPDFNSTFDISLSLVILYSDYVESLITTSVPSRAFRFGNLIVEFEKLVKSILTRNSSFIPKSYYDVKKAHELEFGKVLFMVRKPEFETVFADRVEDYPRKLYMSETFL